jgi:hypothetical protein
MLNVAKDLYAECHYAECRFAECRGAYLEDKGKVSNLANDGMLITKNNIDNGAMTVSMTTFSITTLSTIGFL